MSAKTRTLITLEEVLDHDCGNYKIGEIDFGIRIGPLTEYLEKYGYEGKKEILHMLGVLATQVSNEHMRIVERNNPAQVGS